MNPALLLLLLSSNTGRGFGEEGSLLLTLALAQSGGVQTAGTTTPAPPASPIPTSAGLDPLTLFLLLGLGKGGMCRDDDKRYEPGEKKFPERRSGLDDRALLLALLLSGQNLGGQTLSTVGSGTLLPTPAASAIDPTTLLLLAMGGGEIFGGREALRKHFFRQRAGVDEDCESPDAA